MHANWHGLCPCLLDCQAKHPHKQKQLELSDTDQLCCKTALTIQRCGPRNYDGRHVAGRLLQTKPLPVHIKYALLLRQLATPFCAKELLQLLCTSALPAEHLQHQS